MDKNFHTKVLIIGSGPAGYSAAIYAARAALEPILIAGTQKGGQLTITTDVENYPGFKDVIQGPWLMEQMEAQAIHVGTNIIHDHITSVDFSTSPFKAIGDSKQVYTAETVIICTGAQARWLGLKSESKYQGYGVSGCATCDGFFYKNKEVIIVGGGNTATEEALYLTNHASHVTLIHRKDSLKAEKILQNRLLNHPKISVIWDTVIEEILGTDNPLSVTGARVKNIKTNEVSELKADGVFIAIGHSPTTAIFKNYLEIDESGYIIAHDTYTNIKYVFEAGDVQDKLWRQAITAAGSGCIAALEATKYLNDIT